MKHFPFLLLLFATLVANAQFINIGADNMSVGYSASAQPSVWSVSQNQAAMSFVENTYNIGIFYENMFFIKEMSLKNFVFNWNSDKYGSFGLDVQSFGYKNYSENKFGLAYSMKLYENFSAGIKINYLFYNQTQPYGNISLIAAEVGILYAPFEKLLIGAHLFNPWRAKIRINQQEYLPTVFELATFYKLLDKVRFSAAIEKDLEKPAALKTGVQYEIIDKLWLRTGIWLMDKDYFISAGLGYTYKMITLDLGFQNHPMLGLRSGVSVKANF